MSTNVYARRSQMAPAARVVRAYAAPVNRINGFFAAFDPASQGAFDLDNPPAPWIDLGWVENFQRIAGFQVLKQYRVPQTGAQLFRIEQVKQHQLRASEPQRRDGLDDFLGVLPKIRNRRDNATPPHEFLDVAERMRKIGSRSCLRTFDGVKNPRELTLSG